MNKNLFKALGAALLGIVSFNSCDEKIDTLGDSCEQEKVVLDISIPIAETRLTGTVDETSINNYQVFLFNSNGVLEAYLNKSTSDLSVETTLGNKTIVVLANAPALKSCSTLQNLLEQKSLLTDNGSGCFVMSGMLTKDITSSTVSVVVPVTRLVSKIRLSSFKTAFEMPQYQSMAFKVSAVYLINVPVERKYFSGISSDIWYNKTKHVDNCPLIYDDMDDVTVGPSSPYQKINCFYCYPNIQGTDSFSTSWSPRHTRLVVEALLGNTVYYYPVTLPVMEPNKVYDVNLTVTMPGSTKPDDEIDKYATSFSITVNSWEDGADVSEII